MSFWDRVGDLADAFPVVGNAFNTIVDTARSLDDDDKSTLDAVKGAVGQNYGPSVHAAGQAAGEGLDLAYKAYSFGVARPLSTLEQTTGIGLVGAGPTALLNLFKDHPGLKAAWQQSKDVSPGQASMVNLNRALPGAVGPEDFASAAAAGARGDNTDPWFSFMSGAQDAVLSWYADPLVVAGKTAQATKLARTTLKPGDLAAITTEGAKLTGRQARLQSKWHGLMDITRDKNAAEIYQLAFIRESSAGDTLASLIAKANKETDQAVRDEKVRDILRVGFGDRAYIQQLRERGDSLADDITNLNEPLDWMKAAPDSPEMATRIAQVEDEIGRRSEYLDELDRLRKVEYGLGSQLGPSASGDLLDPVRLSRLRQDSILQSGAGSRPVYAMRWLSGYRPAGWVNLHDGQNVSKNVERMLERVKGLDADTRMHWLGRVLDADTDAARQIELLRLERDVFHHVATQVGGGISDDAIRKLYEQYGKRRHAVLTKWQNRTYSGGEFDGHRADLHFDDDTGMFVARPITDTHLDNEMPLLDVDHIYQVLKRERNSARHLQWLDDTGELTTEVLDRYSQVWKLGALMRLGYMIRTTMDPQLRMLAVLGGMGYLATAGEGATNLMKNRLGRATVDDLTDVAERTRAKARLDEIEARLSSQVEYARNGDTLASHELPSGSAAPGRGAATGGVPAPRPSTGINATGVGEDGQTAFGTTLTGTTDDLSALRAEAERLRARLAEPVKTRTMRRGKTDQKERLGSGRLDVNGYSIEDAHGITPEDFARSFATINARESMRTLMDDTQSGLRKTMRMTGNFDLIDGTKTGYEGAWLKAVNHQIRQSKLSQLIIDGADDQALKRWMRRTTEGRDYVRRMRAIYHGDLDEMIGRHRATIDNALGGHDELYLKARERDLTIEDLAEVRPDRTQWPKINGGVIDQTYNTGMIGPLLERINEQFYRFMSDAPETLMGRHPLYVQLYRQRVREMVRNADPRGEGILTHGDIDDITRAARDYARNEMKRTLFHIDSKSNLAHKLRFVFPFFSAWEDTMVKYGRIVMERPQVLPHSAMLWQAPEQAGLTVDLDGNIVQGGGLTDQHFVLVPSIPGLRGLTSAAQWRLSKSSVNIILQGDPWWIPGWGGLTGYAANEIAKRKPSLGDEFDKAGLLPFGVQTSSWDLLSPEPRWSRYLRKSINPDDQDYKETFAYIYATEAMRINTGEREKPKSEEAFLDEVAKRTRNWYFARAFASGVLPVSASPQGDKQFYFDEAHRFREKYGMDWEKRFYQEYPEYFEAAVSLSKSNTGIDATLPAYNASKKYKDLIARRPEYGWFVVGEEGQGDYNQAVRAAQFGQRVAPGSSTRFRDTKDPRQAVTEVEVDKGWIDYTTMISRLDQQLAALGLHSYQQTGAEKLAAFKKAFIADLGKRNPEWQRDYEDFGGSKTADFLRYAADVVDDKRLRDRGDIQAMRTYLAMRAQIQRVLAGRQSHSLGAQDNGDIATFWSAFGQWLKSRYVTFGDTYDRMLEHDDLSVRV